MVEEGFGGDVGVGRAGGGTARAGDDQAGAAQSTDQIAGNLFAKKLDSSPRVIG